MWDDAEAVVGVLWWAEIAVHTASTFHDVEGVFHG
jgi:hypothetical protein